MTLEEAFEEKRDPTLKEIVDYNINKRFVERIEDFTCYDCCNWQHCDLAFDAYNIGGDCLAGK